MGRIRSIKPEFFLNEDVAALPTQTRLFFIGLWTQADREGRLEDRPARLKAALLPYEAGNVEEMLSSLVAAGFVRRYAVDGIAFLWLPGFSKHQRPHHTERASLFPPCPDETARVTDAPPLTNGAASVPCANGESPAIPPESGPPLTHRSLTPGGGKGGGNGKGKGGGKGSTPRAPLPEDFALTPERAATALANNCREPRLAFQAFTLHYGGLRDDPERGWCVNWPNKWNQWCLHHDRYGCPCQKRTPAGARETFPKRESTALPMGGIGRRVV